MEEESLGDLAMHSDIKETEDRYVGGVYSVVLFPDPGQVSVVCSTKK